FSQGCQLIDTFLCSGIGFQCRCRTAEDNRAPVILSAMNGNIACMIARLIFLFIAVFMLFINYDNPKIFKWGKDSRPGPYHHLYFFTMNTPPFIILFAVG